VQLQTLTPDMARMLGMDPGPRCVVSGVDPDGRAAKAGLRAEDVIVEIDRKPVSSAEEAVSALGRVARPGTCCGPARDTFRFVTIPPQ